MDEELYLITATSAATVIAAKLANKRKRKRRLWVKSWLARWDEKGVYNNLITELRLI